MKFYNDFNSMFKAQSGLKSDMSVFNEIESDGNTVIVTDERGVERTYIYCESAPATEIQGIPAYTLIDFCSSHYDLYSINDIFELIDDACVDMNLVDDGYTIYGSRPLTGIEAHQIASRINEKVLNYL